MKQYAIIRRKRKRNPDGSETWLVQVHPGDHNQAESRRAIKSYRINRKSTEYDCVTLCQVVQSLRLENPAGGVAEFGKPEPVEPPALPSPLEGAKFEASKPAKGGKPAKGNLIADRFA